MLGKVQKIQDSLEWQGLTRVHRMINNEPKTLAAVNLVPKKPPLRLGRDPVVQRPTTIIS